mmetsp:Transcript_25684/g.37844  ORF Transcript_25684/g.37844 Transcript_25684/m.37844 type:complete len:216 (+) Transcript_25684:4449-5096(+)
MTCVEFAAAMPGMLAVTAYALVKRSLTRAACAEVTVTLARMATVRAATWLIASANAVALLSWISAEFATASTNCVTALAFALVPRSSMPAAFAVATVPNALVVAITMPAISTSMLSFPTTLCACTRKTTTTTAGGTVSSTLTALVSVMETMKLMHAGYAAATHPFVLAAWTPRRVITTTLPSFLAFRNVSTILPCSRARGSASRTLIAAATAAAT